MAKKSKNKKPAKKNSKAESKDSKAVGSLIADAENALANFEMKSSDFVEDVFATQTISIKDFDEEMIAAAPAADDETIDATEDAEAESNDSEIETIVGTELELDGFEPAELDEDSQTDFGNEFAGESRTDGLAGTELEGFASGEIEDIEELSMEKIASIVESLLFASEKPQSIAMLKAAFVGTKVKSADIRKAIQLLETQYANVERGVEVYEISGGYQIRTKAENAKFMQQTIKARPFRLSGPALEVLSIVAYKQPCAKVQVDEIRGVESGHLMRGLLERGLIAFGEKSELPGRPMYYHTTKKFLEIFGLRQIEELPTLSEIDQLIPEGIGEPVEEKQTLSDVTEEMSQSAGTTYSEGEEELQAISGDLANINLSTAFFEEEKKRMRDKKDLEKAQEIRERMVIGEAVATREKNWLDKFDNGTLYVAKEFPKGKFGPKGAVAQATAAEAVTDGAIEIASADAETIPTELHAISAEIEADLANENVISEDPVEVEEPSFEGTEGMLSNELAVLTEDSENSMMADSAEAPISDSLSENLDPLEQALQSLRQDNSQEPESEV